MKKAMLLAFSILVGNCFISYSQDKTRFYSLDDIIGISQDQSPDALIARQTFRSSYWDFRSYQASNLPALTFTSTLPNINQSVTSQSINGVQSYASYKGISARANLGLTQKIGITGGTVSINSSLDAQHNANQPDSIVSTPFLSNPINIVLNQPLFTYNAYRWDRKIKPLKYSIARKKYLEDIEQISITATNYFFALLQAQVEKKISITNLSNYDTLYRIAKGRYQLGKIAENDLLQLELSYLKAQAQVENADLALDNAQFRLKSYLRIQDTLRIVLLPPANVKFFKINPAEAVALAIENSSNALDFKKRLLEGASSVNQAKTEGRFDANIYAVIGLNKTASTIPEAYKNPGDERQVSLGLTIPIVDWGVARGRINVAQSQMEIIKNGVEQDSIDFQQNVYLKVIQFNMQQNQLMIAAKSDTVARKSYEVTKGRYLIGKINSILDLNNAQIETDNSQKNYYYALQTFWRSYFEIRKMTLYDFTKDKPIEFDLKNFK
ncbi:MAG: TolC family protein [Bacteroidota bacterium]